MTGDLRGQIKTDCRLVYIIITDACFRIRKNNKNMTCSKTYIRLWRNKLAIVREG